ncbi:zinc-binding dehydrogenase [Nocardioides sp. HDW12B]|uniref:zinc-binding dehydrogenase n=1 Tax=Nocardioides sp. HDW12B TaxID=2714939 RepID=UPI0014084557|nr:zinc-binding dehydrogenase [Nocardioides sp. HDW12B]QIK67354.1 zinc-binding dehydrogenase [Nocardioides sp. HDW12B]
MKAETVAETVAEKITARAARIHGRGQVAVGEVELPALGARELLLEVVSSSMCLSTYKAMSLGSDHKRVPDDIEDVPVITGHEFAGVLRQVGSGLGDDFAVGQHVAVLPTMMLPSGDSPGYSYPFYGGDTTYTVIPEVAVDKGCVLPYDGDYFANASLAEPMSCIIGAFHASYHTRPLVWEHDMGLKREGSLALLGCGGAMGIGALDYALHGPFGSRTVVAVDVSRERLDRLRDLFPPEKAAQEGVRLEYVDASQVDAGEALREIHPEGYDDVVVFAAHRELVETGDAVLGHDGCLNFFAGPTDKEFTAGLNLYNLHYEATHAVGTSGGGRADMEESLRLSAEGRIDPSTMVTHVGGLQAVPGALQGLPDFTGGKILAYPHVDLPLTAIADLGSLAAEDDRFGELARLVSATDGIWNKQAEVYLREHFDAQRAHGNRAAGGAS